MSRIQQSNNLGWEFVFKLIDVYKHLKERDLKELALSSKSMLTQLNPILFGKVKITNKNRDYIAKLPKKILRDFKKNRNRIGLVNSVSISYKIDKNDHFTFLTYFPHITTLTLTSVRFDLEHLNLFLNNLKSLKYLELKRVRINISVSLAIHRENCDLSIPLNLNELKVYSCTYYDFNDLSILDSREIIKMEKYQPYLSISRLKFQNLTQLTYIDTNKQKYHFLNNFLLNNPNLKRLCVELFECNRETFELLANLKSLKYINLLRCNKPFSVENDLVTPFNSLASLSLDQTAYSSNYEFIRKMTLLCPNLHYLKLFYKHRNNHEIERLVKGLERLKSLVLISKKEEKRFKLDLESDSLVRVNFVNFYLDNINLRKFQTLTKLRVLKLTNYHSAEEIDKEKLAEKFGEFRFNVNFIRQSLLCSKF